MEEYDSIIHLFLSKRFNECEKLLKTIVDQNNSLAEIILYFYCLIEKKKYNEVNYFLEKNPQILTFKDNSLLKLIIALNYYYQYNFEQALLILSDYNCSNHTETQFQQYFVNEFLIPINNLFHSGIF